jgi:hypothetical protein
MKVSSVEYGFKGSLRSEEHGLKMFMRSEEHMKIFNLFFSVLQRPEEGLVETERKAHFLGRNKHKRYRNAEKYIGNH